MDRLKKSKDKVRYGIEFRVDGKKYRQHVGFSVEEARDADGKRRSQKREGRIFDMLPKSDKTFSQIKTWYLDLNKIKKLAMYRNGVLKILLDKFDARFGKVLVGTIKVSALENYQSELKDQGLSNSYIDQVFGAARAAINKAFEDDEIGGDCLRPFRKLPKMMRRNSENARDRALTADEFDRLYAAASRHVAPILATAYWTGMRRGEILNLRRDRIDIAGRMINLRAEDTKDAEARSIPILDPLAQILDRIPRAIHTDYVFLYRGLPVKDVRAAVAVACRKAGIPYGRGVVGGFTFHDLRHTFVTNMRRAGVAEKVIMAWTGHATADMMHRYDSVDINDVRAAGLVLVNSLEILADKAVCNE